LKKLGLALAVGAAAISVAANAAVVLYEESLAREEEKRILTHPIAGIENSLWFDYRIDVTEAQKELSSDLRRASDVEDLRDAWEEYAFELRHEREDYIHDMAKRGYRGYVTLEN
jgi:methylthioribose-1-phosphate isomerase